MIAKLTLICALLFTVSYADIICKSPANDIGRYAKSPDGQQCTGIIKAYCDGSRTTSAWSRGRQVSANCGNLKMYTAIATFAGPGNKYNGGSYQHAAIFKSCAPDGINVWDQWVSQPIHERKIRYSGSGSNGGHNFYTIV